MIRGRSTRASAVPLHLQQTGSRRAWHGRARVLLLGALALPGCSRRPPELGAADYAVLALPKRCNAGEKSGAAGATDQVVTRDNVRFSVRTPRNYDSTLAHPLLVVFAPAGYQRHASEQYYGLTPEATAAGFVVAYPDHLGLSLRAFEALGQVPSEISEKWCIDKTRVYFAGHSDGGTTSAAVAFLRASPLAPSALFISAAGIRKQDLTAYACPPPLSVMVVHSSKDNLFPLPDYGKQAAQWWAQCNRCSQETGRSDYAGCVEYSRCAGNVNTAYCEVHTSHAEWPAVNANLLRFLSRASRDKASPRQGD